MNTFAELEEGITTTSAEETRRVAQAFAAHLPPDSVIALHGNLGVGKTTFVQGLADAFGIREAVTSPTFNIFTLHRGSRILMHLDAYRLEHSRQVDDLMLEDFLISPFCLAVEWPEKIADWIPDNSFHLTLSILPGETHRIVLAKRKP